MAFLRRSLSTKTSRFQSSVATATTSYAASIQDAFPSLVISGAADQAVTPQGSFAEAQAEVRHLPIELD